MALNMLAKYQPVAWCRSSYAHEGEMPLFAAQLCTGHMLILAARADTTVHDAVNVERQAEWVASVAAGDESKSC